jgi:LPS-assembly protein
MQHFYKIIVCTLLVLTYNQLVGKKLVNTTNILHGFDISLTDTVPPVLDDSLKLQKFIKREAPVTTISSTQKNTNDTVPKKITTTDTFNIKTSKDSLDAPIDYKASDSMVVLIKQEKIILYNKGNLIYKDNNIDADKIIFDQKTNLLTAYGERDSLGEIINQGRFTQGENKGSFDSLTFNMKNQVGTSSRVFTKTGELFVNSEKSKKADSITTFGKNNTISTCNLDEPHFGFKARKLKYVQDKVIVTGAIQPVFEGVPIPLGLPFGIFPQRKGRHSGFLAPQFAVNERLGLGLEGLGWYHVFNDYVDVIARSNLYSFGSWNLFVTPTYRKRYKYNGSLTLSLQRTRNAFKGDPDFSKATTFNVSWNHTMDSKVRPGVSFSANVNAGSSKYNQNIPNNPFVNVNNQLNSSIAYSKQFKDKANLTITGGHNQNTITKQVNINLPDVNFNLNTIYPFENKEGVGKSKWYEKLGIGLNSNVKTAVVFYDTVNNIVKRILDTFQWGATHSIPIQLSLPSLGPFQVTPNIGYDEKWYSMKNLRSWNNTTNKIDTAIERGFFTSRNFSFGVSFATALFGTANFGKNSRLRAIRHVLRPTANISYTPKTNSKYFYNLQIDTAKNFIPVSVFDGNFIGAPSNNQGANLGFQVDNNLEMKWRKKGTDTSQGEEKKIKILDGFGFSGSYNFLADSFPLTPITLYARTNLFEKIDINITGSLDPYERNKQGFATKRFAWQGEKFSLGSITSASVSVGTRLQSQRKDQGKEEGEDKHNNDYQQTLTMDEQQQALNYINSNPAEFVDFNIPWSATLDFSYTYGRSLVNTPTGYTYAVNTNTNVRFGGDVSVTPKWKAGYNGFFDISNRKLTQFTMFFTREMHCWQLSINVVPVSAGGFRSFNITINPKSSLLRDLRINRSRFFYGQ